MKKKPYNDNLVMASIESLYNQATDTPLPADAGIRRRDTGKLPILGSLPVSVSVDAADKGGDHLEDMVLTGLLDAVSGEPPVPVAAGPADETDENPFLAIRQAVISAGQNVQPDPAPEQRSGQPPLTEKQTFAGQLAELIDAEIERRMAERLNTQTKPAPQTKAPAKRSSVKTKQVKTTAKAKQPAKSGKKTKAQKSRVKEATKSPRETKT